MTSYRLKMPVESIPFPEQFKILSNQFKKLSNQFKVLSKQFIV